MMAKAGSGTDGAGRNGQGRAVHAPGAPRRGLRAAAMALAATAAVQPPKISAPRIPVETFVLPNGLTVLLSVDHFYRTTISFPLCIRPLF